MAFVCMHDAANHRDAGVYQPQGKKKVRVPTDWMGRTKTGQLLPDVFFLLFDGIFAASICCHRREPDGGSEDRLDSVR